ncbi:hypothetical protein GBAR_LOCUS7147 [Geodia barretti]|nr:hypothetical protein GBAR_LOCUS7147 [Geodia barretti]
MAGAIQLVVLCALLLPCVDVSLAQVNATQMAVAVYETLSPFMTEMREGLAAVKTEMTAMKRNLRAMEGKVNHLSREVVAQKNQTTSGLAVLESVKEEITTVKTKLESHKTSVVEEFEAVINNQNTFDFKLDSLDLKQDRMTLNQGRLGLKQDRLAFKMTTARSELEVKISNITKLQQSAERHVTLIQSQLSSVNASIGNKLIIMEKLLARNDTGCERPDIETFSHEQLLQTLLNSQSELQIRVLSNITKELEMSAEYHVTSFESTLASGLSSVDVGIQNGLRKIGSQIAKNCTAVGAEILSSIAGEFDVVVNNQNTIELQLKVLSNNTKELRQSAENHVTAIESQLTSVDAGIRNELRKLKVRFQRTALDQSWRYSQMKMYWRHWCQSILASLDK